MQLSMMNRFAAIAGLSAMILGGPVAAAHADAPAWDIHQDRRDIRHDRWGINKDQRDIRQDHRQIGRLDRRLLYDVNHDRFHAAKQTAFQINRDHRDIRFDRRDINHDRRDLRHDRQDLRYDR